MIWEDSRLDRIILHVFLLILVVLIEKFLEFRIARCDTKLLVDAIERVSMILLQWDMR